MAKPPARLWQEMATTDFARLDPERAIAVRLPQSSSTHRMTGQAQRVEIMSAKERRRRWSDEEKRRLGTDVLSRIKGT